MKYADVIVDITAEQLDRTFQYKVPESLRRELRVGMQVEIPFGSGGRVRKGYLISLTDRAAIPEERMKEIIGPAPGALGVESKLIALAAWIRENYGSTMLQALRTVLPVKEKIRAREERTLVLALDEEQAQERLEEYKRRRQTARQRLLEELMREKRLDYMRAARELKATRRW